MKEDYARLKEAKTRDEDLLSKLKEENAKLKEDNSRHIDPSSGGLSEELARMK